mmetsp:Transcript_15710/g.37479  ORF Transcript_15710/g.37479 Transcript_15710/m.37479 type:complete len:219 (-) Transcript_15710:586-1242(-)
MVFTMAAIGAIEWYVVEQDVSSLETRVSLSVWGVRRTCLKGSGVDECLQYNVWDGKCSGSDLCDNVDALDCSELQKDLEEDRGDENDRNQWEYDAQCPLAKATFSFMFLGLLAAGGSIGLTVMVILEKGGRKLHMIALGVCGFAVLCFVLSILIYGGGVLGKVDVDWFKGAETVGPGASYVLAVLSCFLSVGALVLLGLTWLHKESVASLQGRQVTRL